MGKIDKNKARKRSYKSYNDDDLRKALKQIEQKKISINKAAGAFGIPKGTLINKVHQKHNNQVGRAPVLSVAEESAIIQHAIAVSEWGFPFCQEDLCQLVKLYLTKCGRVVSEFRNNLPSRYWFVRFRKRHSNETVQRMCQNIKRSKAALTPEAMEKYFDYLKATLTLEDGSMVPPEQIFNYDETNRSDDPGSKRCLFKRGVKYPERVKDFSKSSMSLMFCGSAVGKMLPPYVVYKSVHLYGTWMQGGPPHTRYNRSKSGWFDGEIFKDWFFELFVPYVKKKKFQGKIVLIGDNLSSHFSKDIISACKDLNIVFVCLLANSTHLSQPLDVGFYGPLKNYWRGILDVWKSGKQKKSQTITKEKFPALLTKLCEKVVDKDNGISHNLISGFRKCGIYPFDPHQVIDRKPKKRAENDALADQRVSEAVIDMLSDLRNASPEPQKKQRKKLNIEPGKSVSLEDFNVSETAVNVEIGGSTGVVSVANETAEITESDCDQADGEVSNSEATFPSTSKVVEVSDFIIVEFPLPGNISKYYVAQVKEVNRDFYTVTFMKKAKSNFIFPKTVFEKIILSTQVKQILSAPVTMKKHFIFDSNELENLKIQ